MDNTLFLSWKDFSRLQRVLLAVFFVIYIFLRMKIRLQPVLLNDEIVTLHGLQYPFLFWMMTYLPGSDFHFPPSYFLLYPIGHWISDNRFIVCIPYVLISSFFYWFIVRINWFYFLRLKPENYHIHLGWVSSLVAILITYNATLVEHAFTVRPYALLGFLALLALIASDAILNSKRIKMTHILWVAGIVAFHNYGILMLAVSFLFLILNRIAGGDWSLINREIIVSIIGTIAAGVLLSWPVWDYYSHARVLLMFDHSPYTPATHPNVHLYIKEGFRGIAQVAALYYGFKPLRWLLFFLTVIGTIRLCTQKKFSTLVMLAALVIGPTFAIYWLARSSNYYFIPRSFIWVMPFHAVFVSVSVLVALDWMSGLIRKRQVAAT